MKTKILLPFALIFFTATVSNAQINEGRYLLGGSIGYSHQKDAQNSSAKYESLNTNIQFGKVVKENTVAGIIVSYSYSNGVSNYKSNQFGAGVFYRKYKPLAKNFYFFGEADALYNYWQNKQGVIQPGSNGLKNTSNGGTISFIPGISYSVCKNMQIELSMPNIASISYAGTKYETTSIGTNSISTTKGNNFSVNANLNTNLLSNFGIGFKFFLGK